MNSMGPILFGAAGFCYWYYKMFRASGNSFVWNRAYYRWRPKNLDSVIVPSFSSVVYMMVLTISKSQNTLMPNTMHFSGKPSKKA